MCTKLPNNVQEERLRWIMPIISKQVRLKDVASVSPGGQRTLERWVASYKQGGRDGLKPRSTRPKTQPRETSIRIKERIINWQLVDPKFKKTVESLVEKPRYKIVLNQIF